MKLYPLAMIKLSLLAIVIFFSSASFGSSTPQPSEGQIERISDFYSEFVPARNIDVWLPADYSSNTRYDVLYMHDGQMLFDADTTWNNQEWAVDEVASELMKSDKVRPFIVVGIWNSGSTRYPEYFPEKVYRDLPWLERMTVKLKLAWHSKSIAPFGDFYFADRYIQFLASELIPFIENNYSVNKGQPHRYLAGSSMGALISWYALMERPDVFAGAASMSTHWPGMYNTNNPFPDGFEHYFKQHLTKLNGHKLYFDLGDQTLDAQYPPLQKRIDHILQTEYSEGTWQTEFFPGHKHDEHSWSNRLHIPLTFLFSQEP